MNEQLGLCDINRCEKKKRQKIERLEEKQTLCTQTFSLQIWCIAVQYITLTYIELPNDFVHRWFGVDAAFKVHIIALIEDLVPLLKSSQNVPKKVKKGQLKLHFQKVLYTDSLTSILHSKYLHIVTLIKDLIPLLKCSQKSAQ